MTGTKKTYLRRQSLECDIGRRVVSFALSATRRELHFESVAIKAERTIFVAAHGM